MHLSLYLYIRMCVYDYGGRDLNSTDPVLGDVCADLFGDAGLYGSM